MNHLRNRRAWAMRWLVRIAGGLLLPVTLLASAGERAEVLIHRFTVAQPDEWVSIELRPATTIWHREISGGAAARFDEVRAVLGSLKGIAIGARCPGFTRGPVHYPCALDLDVRQHGDTADTLESWTSTTTHKLMRPDEGIASALSTPRQEPGSIAVAGETGLLALVAPTGFETQWAEDRPLRIRLRVRPAPVSDDGTGIEAAQQVRAAVFPAQALIVISTRPLRPVPVKPASDGKHNV